MGLTGHILTLCLVITYGTYTHGLKCHVCTGFEYQTDNEMLKGMLDGLLGGLGGLGDIGANLTGAGGDSLNMFVDWCNDFSKKPGNVAAQECSLFNTGMGITFMNKPSSEVEYRCFRMKNVTSLSMETMGEKFAVDYITYGRGCARVPKTGEMVSDVANGCHDADDNSYVKTEMEAANQAGSDSTEMGDTGGMGGLDPDMGTLVGSKTDVCFCSDEKCNTPRAKEWEDPHASTASTAAVHTATLLATVALVLSHMLL